MEALLLMALYWMVLALCLGAFLVVFFVLSWSVVVVVFFFFFFFWSHFVSNSCNLLLSWLLYC